MEGKKSKKDVPKVLIRYEKYTEAFKNKDLPWRPPNLLPGTKPGRRKIRPNNITSNALFSSVVPGLMGCGLGAFIGLFMSSFHANSTMINPDNPPTLRETWLDIKSTVMRNAKNFGKIGFMFTFWMTVIEKRRAKRDIYNEIGAGAITGAQMGLRGGTRTMLMGSASFAAFSLVAAYFMSDFVV